MASVLVLWPGSAAGRAGVVPPPQRRRGGQQPVLALASGGAAIDQLDVVVEGQRRQVTAAGGGLPGLHEPLGLGDLAGPVLGGPEPDAVGAAEVAVDVGADRVPVQPRQTDLGDGVEDLLGRQEPDVGGADRLLPA